MALLKSLALQEQELAEDLRREEADACYAVIDGWDAQAKKLPINTSTAIEPPLGKKRPDDKPFGYHYGNLPSRHASRHARWSEI